MVAQNNCKPCPVPPREVGTIAVYLPKYKAGDLVWLKDGGNLWSLIHGKKTLCRVHWISYKSVDSQSPADPRYCVIPIHNNAQMTLCDESSLLPYSPGDGVAGAVPGGGNPPKDLGTFVGWDKPIPTCYDNPFNINNAREAELRGSHE
jgi:hypothetical protein